jgi:hypothetical protein
MSGTPTKMSTRRTALRVSRAARLARLPCVETTRRPTSRLPTVWPFITISQPAKKPYSRAKATSSRSAAHQSERKLKNPPSSRQTATTMAMATLSSR